MVFKCFKVVDNPMTLPPKAILPAHHLGRELLAVAWPEAGYRAYLCS